MSTELIQTIGMIVIIVAIVFTVRWTTGYFIRKALKKEGFETEAIFTEIGDKKILMATDQYGTVLAAKIADYPTNLKVHIKTALVPVLWQTYHFIILSDGTRLHAESI